MSTLSLWARRDPFAELDALFRSAGEAERDGEDGNGQRRGEPEAPVVPEQGNRHGRRRVRGVAPAPDADLARQR